MLTGPSGSVQVRLVELDSDTYRLLTGYDQLAGFPRFVSEKVAVRLGPAF
jgi:hypothetical protein